MRIRSLPGTRALTWPLYVMNPSFECSSSDRASLSLSSASVMAVSTSVLAPGSVAERLPHEHDREAPWHILFLDDEDFPALALGRIAVVVVTDTVVGARRRASDAARFATLQAVGQADRVQRERAAGHDRRATGDEAEDGVARLVFRLHEQHVDGSPLELGVEPRQEGRIHMKPHRRNRRLLWWAVAGLSRRAWVAKV